MDFYYFPTSYWSRTISLVLAEKRLEPERHLVDISNNESFEPWYMRINPRGVVPTLVDDGKVIFDSLRMATYLEDKAGPDLGTRDPVTQGWMERLEDFPLMLLSYSVWTQARRGERSAQILDDKVTRAQHYADAHPDLRELYERKRAFFEKFRASVYDAEHVAKQIQHCGQELDEIASVVSGQPWLGGPAYSFADSIMTGILYRLVDLQLVDDWSHDAGDPLFGYYERLRARPSFREVFVDDPLISRGH